MTTEAVDPRFAELDSWPIANALEAMWEGQLAAVAAVRPALPVMAEAIEAAAAALGPSGRLVYVGAGTSGRVAVQDGTELPPTFGWPLARIVFAIAGGETALIRSVEGAEDDTGDGAGLMRAGGVGPSDVVIGVAASGSTPFTVAALRQATAQGAVTIGISNNEGAKLLQAVRFGVVVATGSEVIAGSTRMKAGTAQKVVLNLISTGIMLRLGRVYRGLMVHMQPSNVKLQGRACAMVATIAGCDPQTASAALSAADGDIKQASLLALGCAPDQARALLAQSAGNLRLALAALAD